MSKKSKIIVEVLIAVMVVGIGYIFIPKNSENTNSKITAALKNAPKAVQQDDELGIMGAGGEVKKVGDTGNEERQREEMRKRLLKLSSVIELWINVEQKKQSDPVWEAIDKIENILESYGDQLVYSFTSLDLKLSGSNSIKTELAKKRDNNLIGIKLNWESSILKTLEQKGNLIEKIATLKDKIDSLQQQVENREKAIVVNLEILRKIRDAIYTGEGRLADWTALRLNILPNLEAKIVITAAYAAGDIDGIITKLSDEIGKLLSTNGENKKALDEVVAMINEVKQSKKVLKDIVEAGFSAEGKENRTGIYSSYDYLPSLFSGLDIILDSLQSLISTFPSSNAQSAQTTLTDFKAVWSDVKNYSAL